MTDESNIDENYIGKPMIASTECTKKMTGLHGRTACSLVIMILALAGCSWIDKYDRRDKYLEAESIPPTQIPPELDPPPFEAALPIPQVADARGLAGKKFEIGLPQAVSTSYGVEKVVIKKLGDSRWVFLDATPSTVWPKIVRFFASTNMDVALADPRRGVLESEWISTRDDGAEKIVASIAEQDFNRATIANRFRVSIEPGIRSGSSEVYLETRQLSLGAGSLPEDVSWEGKSDDVELEAALLTKLAYYLGESISEPVFSIGATALREEKARLIPDVVSPILIYKLEFERAWATVGSALKNARIPVEDLDRTAQIYYIYYDPSRVFKEEPGFFSRLFSKEEDVQALDDAHRYKILLQTPEGATGVTDVKVTIQNKNGNPADALLAEGLLRVIKESST
ncbi:MAG: outer membrane protein assembly factor BamC [Pseudomonadales bacterium]|nr:outer membrane protein assembly factor BamC [Pseudomonadales bacterium]MDG1444529.1 outer membrane protein assembly factor BamC [Pseudomonadales bacterium]